MRAETSPTHFRGNVAGARYAARCATRYPESSGTPLALRMREPIEQPDLAFEDRANLLSADLPAPRIRKALMSSNPLVYATSMESALS